MSVNLENQNQVVGSTPCNGARHHVRRGGASEKLPGAVRSGAGSLWDLFWVVGADPSDCVFAGLRVLVVTPGGSDSGGPRSSLPSSGESDPDHAVPFFSAPTCPELQLQEGKSVSESGVSDGRSVQKWTFWNVCAYFSDTKCQRASVGEVL